MRINHKIITEIEGQQIKEGRYGIIKLTKEQYIRIKLYLKELLNGKC